MALIFWSGQSMAAKPEIKVDYQAEYNRIIKPVVYDPNNDAAPLYQKAFDTYVEIPDLLKNKNRHIPLKRFSVEEIKCLRNWLDSNADCINYFHQAAIKPYWWIERQADTNADEMAFSEITPFRKVVYVVDWEIKLKAYDGQYKEAFEQLFDIYSASAHLMSPKTFVEQLTGLAARALASKTVFSILDEQIDPSLLKLFKQKLEIYMQNHRIDIEFSKGEYLYLLSAIQGCFTDDGNGNGKLIPSALAKMTKDLKNFDGSSLKVSYPKALLVSLTHPNKKDTLELAEKYRDYFNKLIKQAPWQLNKEKTTYANSLAVFIKGNHFLSFGSSKSEGFICELKHREEALNSALIATIAIIEYKNQQKEFPEKLDDLITNGYLNSLPIDPYSGKPLEYKKTANNFIIYSIGADFKDNDGISSNWGTGKEGGDQVFWPVQF